jgi:acetyl esterase
MLASSIEDNAKNDKTARSRHRRDHSPAPVARSQDHDAAKRPRCAARARGLPRRGSSATGRKHGRYRGRGGRRSAWGAGLSRRNGAVADGCVLHGGGWVAGDLETHDRQARWLAIESGAVVVSVDYRRPPEVRFPGAFEDAFAAVRDVSARIAAFGGDTKHLGVAGDSAGGNLAAAVAIACRDAGIKLAAQLLVYPVTDAAGHYADANENAPFPSRRENAEGYFLSRAVMEWFCGHYLADQSHGADWRVSPLRATDHAGLAPAIVCTAWFDPLRDEGVAYAAALKAAYVPVKHYPGEGLIHGYFGLGEASDTARAEAQRARAEFKSLLERGS